MSSGPRRCCSCFCRSVGPCAARCFRELELAAEQGGCTARRDRHHHTVGLVLFGSCWGGLLSGDALLSCIRAGSTLLGLGGQAMAGAEHGEPLLSTWGSACCGAVVLPLPWSAVLILAGRPARAVPRQPGGTAGLAARAGAGRSLGQSRAPQPCCVCPSRAPRGALALPLAPSFSSRKNPVLLSQTPLQPHPLCSGFS